MATDYDILVLGGGINGAGIARDAVGRGYSVCLCDAADFGSGTSSASTKLVHGGLRYLEHYEFRLVREALKEREILWAMAPHIVRPLRFVLPHHRGLRPAWLLRLGLFFYDSLGGRKHLPGTQTLDLRREAAGAPLKSEFRRAFEYSDCWVEDARLVILNLRDAEDKGADIKPRVAAKKAIYRDSQWQVELVDGQTGRRECVTASLLINATGPHVDAVLKSVFGRNDAQFVRLVRGSHIVVRKKFDHERCYIFQNADDRVIFAIPFEEDFTLIGTTDVEHGAAEIAPEISAEEIDYLCKTASHYFLEPVVKDDIVWTYSGVRPLFDDGASKAQEATRDYVIRCDETVGAGTLLNIFGGKITTYRRLAEAVMAEVEARLGPRGAHWTEGSTLPGGDFPLTGLNDLLGNFQSRYDFIDPNVMARLVRSYGTKTATLLSGIKSLADLGQDFGAGLYEAEVRYLIDHEWARESDDILYRRTKLGIRMSTDQIDKLQHWVTTAVAQSGVNSVAGASIR